MKNHGSIDRLTLGFEDNFSMPLLLYNHSSAEHQVK
jgi:hypothetical protein